jgi:hypothetical protein
MSKDIAPLGPRGCRGLPRERRGSQLNVRLLFFFGARHVSLRSFIIIQRCPAIIVNEFVDCFAFDSGYSFSRPTLHCQTLRFKTLYPL